MWINVPAALAGSVGALATGWLAERLSRRYPNAIAWLPGYGMILAVPFYVLAFSTDNLWICAIGLCLGGLSKYGYLAAQYTIGQGVVSAQVRAVSTFFDELGASHPQLPAAAVLAANDATAMRRA